MLRRTVRVAVVGAEITKRVYAKPTKWQERWLPVKCALCGSDHRHNPRYGHLPYVCWDCNRRIFDEVKRLGLGGGYCRTTCMDCGHPIVARVAARNDSRCGRCKAKADSRKKEQKSTVNPEVRRKRLVAAMEILTRQYGITEYEAPLGVIAGRLTKSKWWDSASEIVVAAELLRLGLRVKPQLEIGRHRVDLFVPDRNLVIEVDGDLFHGTEEAKHRDTRYDARAILDGYRIARVNAKDVIADVRKAVFVAMQTARDHETYGLQRERIIWTSPEYNVYLKRQALDTAYDIIRAAQRKRKSKR